MVYSKSYPTPSPVMSRQTLILANICCWNCCRTTIIATGEAIGTARTRTQPCRTPKHRTIQVAIENGVDTAAGASKSSLVCVLNTKESGHRRVNHRNKGERSDSYENTLPVFKQQPTRPRTQQSLPCNRKIPVCILFLSVVGWLSVAVMYTSGAVIPLGVLVFVAVSSAPHDA